MRQPTTNQFLKSSMRYTSLMANRSMINGDSGGMLAIRRGPWKYIEGTYPEAAPRHFHSRSTEPQLYNLDRDIKEEHNVIDTHPRIADQLQRELDAIRDASSERALMQTHKEEFRLNK